MPVAHAIAVVLLASLVQLPSVAGEGGCGRSMHENPVGAHESRANPAPANSDRQAHDEIVPSPREEADEWRECEDDELSARVSLPGAIHVSPCLPSDQAGSDCLGLRLTRHRARFLLCGRLNC
jgi:hypothetical protein